MPRAASEQERFLKCLFHRQEELQQVLASAIHDRIAQQLTGALLHFEGAEESLPLAPENARTTFRMGLKLLRDSIHDARRIAGRLRPFVCADHGIAIGIEYLIHEMIGQDGPRITFVAKGELGRLAPEAESAVFCILRELLTNACRHSGSEEVRLEVERTGDRFRLDVADGGIGFDPACVPRNAFGLREVKQRARLLGGEVIVDSVPGEGTRVVITLPLDQAAQGGEPAAGVDVPTPSPTDTL